MQINRHENYCQQSITMIKSINRSVIQLMDMHDHSTLHIRTYTYMSVLYVSLQQNSCTHYTYTIRHTWWCLSFSFLCDWLGALVTAIITYNVWLHNNCTHILRYIEYIPNKVFQICFKGSLMVDVDWGANKNLQCQHLCSV